MKGYVSVVIEAVFSRLLCMKDMLNIYIKTPLLESLFNEVVGLPILYFKKYYSTCALVRIFKFLKASFCSTPLKDCFSQKFFAFQ